MIGKQLGNYVVRATLGEGGMATVYVGEHRFLGDRVAIKILRGSFANDSNGAQRFFQEAKAGRDIEHPNVIRIVDFGQADDGVLYLVMELLQGESLADRIKRGRFDEKEAAAVGAAIADALAAAHEKGIVHRDLKPANIFVTPERVKVLDFGIAKVVDALSMTDTGQLLGTPRYMAPEQARGAKFVGPQSDIYSLGVILYLMVTGQPPFDGTELTELLTKVLFDAPPRPSEHAPVSAAMEAIILQCLEKEPSARPSGMVEVRNRLLSLAGDHPLRPTGVKIDAVGLADTISGSAGEARALGNVDDGAGSRRRGRVAAAFAVAVLLVGGAGGALWHARSRSSRERGSERTAALPQDQPTTHLSVPTPPTLAAPAPPPAAPPQVPKVIVRTDPPGATVIVDGKSAGTTPVLLELQLPHQVSVELDGYKPGHEVVSAPGEISIRLVAETKPTPPRPSGKRKPPKRERPGEESPPLGLD